MSNKNDWEHLTADLCAYREEQRRAWGDIDDILVSRYLAGETTSDETQQVEAAAATHPELTRLFDLVNQTLGSVESSTGSEPTCETTSLKAQWDRLAGELQTQRASQRQLWGTIDETALGRYLAGQASAEECAQILSASSDYPFLAELMALVRQTLEPAAAEQSPDILPFEAASASPSRDYQLSTVLPRKRRRRLAVLLPLSVAASVLLAGVSSLVWVLTLETEKEFVQTAVLPDFDFQPGAAKNGEPRGKPIFVVPLDDGKKKKGPKRIEPIEPFQPEVVPPPPLLKEQPEDPAVKKEREARARREQFRLARQLAQQALAEKDFDQAKHWFKEAAAIEDSGEVREGLKLAEAGKSLQLQLELAERQRAAELKKKSEFHRLVTQARSALDAKQFDIAMAGFIEARKLFPNDEWVLLQLDHARKGFLRSQEDDAADKGVPPEKYDERAYRKAFVAGQFALAKRDMDAAREAFRRALAAKNNDPAALRGLRKADEERERLEAEKSGADKKYQAMAAARMKDQEHRSAMGAGALATHNGDFRAAVAAFARAKEARPRDAEAESAWNEARVALERQAETREKPVLAPGTVVDNARQKQIEFQNLLMQGRQQLQAGSFNAATLTFANALQLSPGQKDAAAGLNEAREKFDKKVDRENLIALIKEKKLENEQRERALAITLDQGQMAIRKKDFDGARRTFAEAVDMQPDSARAVAGLREANQAFDDAIIRKQAQEARQAAIDQARKLDKDYDDRVDRGRKALRGKQFDVAMDSFIQAERIRPGNSQARDLIQETQRSRLDFEAQEPARKDDNFVKARPKPPKVRPPRSEPIEDDIEVTRPKTNPPRVVPVEVPTRPAPPTAAEPKVERTRPRRNHDYLAAISSGWTALGREKYGEAIEAFNRALNFKPGDDDANNALQAAIKGRARAEAAAEARVKMKDPAPQVKPPDDGAAQRLADKKRQDDENREAKLANLLAFGRIDMDRQQFDSAQSTFNRARALAPDSPAVLAVIQDLREARQRAIDNAVGVRPVKGKPKQKTP